MRCLFRNSSWSLALPLPLPRNKIQADSSGHGILCSMPAYTNEELNKIKLLLQQNRNPMLRAAGNTLNSDALVAFFDAFQSQPNDKQNDFLGLWHKKIEIEDTLACAYVKINSSEQNENKFLRAAEILSDVTPSYLAYNEVKDEFDASLASLNIRDEYKPDDMLRALLQHPRCTKDIVEKIKGIIAGHALLEVVMTEHENKSRPHF